MNRDQYSTITTITEKSLKPTEQKESDDAWYSELLTTPVDTPVKTEDDATNKGTRASPDTEGFFAPHPQECAREKHTVPGAGCLQRGLNVCTGC